MSVKAVLKAYAENTNKKIMDEEHYQCYRLALLTRWLEKIPMMRISGRRIWYCSVCDPRYSTPFDVDQAVQHIKVHMPEAFAND